MVFGYGFLTSVVAFSLPIEQVTPASFQSLNSSWLPARRASVTKSEYSWTSLLNAYGSGRRVYDDYFRLA
ncbi:MAG: hypothetical protein JWM16_6437 [Verrucomicrobiales bacterium]|nr:hypothetical protein [Verrucomicrobiales bacterium]